MIVLAVLVIAALVMQVEAPSPDTPVAQPTGDLAAQVHRLVRKLDAPESEGAMWRRRRRGAWAGGG